MCDGGRGGGQRSTLQSSFFLLTSTSMWAPGSELMLPSLHLWAAGTFLAEPSRCLFLPSRLSFVQTFTRATSFCGIASLVWPQRMCQGRAAGLRWSVWTRPFLRSELWVSLLSAFIPGELHLAGGPLQWEDRKNEELNEELSCSLGLGESFRCWGPSLCLWWWWNAVGGYFDSYSFNFEIKKKITTFL